MLVQVVHAKSDFGIPTQEMIKYLLFEAFKKTHTRIDHIFDLIYECVLSWLQLKITRADYRPLTTAERENNVLVSVKHRKRTFFHMYDYSRTIQNNEAAQNLSYFVPENGIIQIEFPVQKNTTALEVKVYFPIILCQN